MLTSVFITFSAWVKTQALKNFRVKWNFNHLKPKLGNDLNNGNHRNFYYYSLLQTNE